MTRKFTSIGNFRSHAAGFSLVELMVALALGLLILAALLESFNSNSATGTTNTRFTEVQTNGRYATDFMRREIQHAGFLGLSWIALKKSGATGTADYGCGAGFVTKIEQPIWGSNDVNALSCIASADYARGDVLVLRRLGLEPVPSVPPVPPSCATASPACAANKLYVRTEFLQGTVFLGTTAPPVNLQPPFEDYPLAADVYYISSYTTALGDGVPALKRLTLGAGPAMSSPQVIASGIENMQIQYGVVTLGAVNFLNASAVPATDWPNVVAVRLWLLARSTDPEYNGFTNTSTYAMGDQTVTMSDNFPRQVFPLVVQLRR